MIRRPALTRRSALAAVASAGLECAWLYTLLHAVNEGLHVAASVPSLFLSYAAAYFCALGLRALGLSRRVVLIVSWALWPPATLLLLVTVLGGFGGIAQAVEATVFMVLSAGALWFLGSYLAGSPLTFRSVMVRFQFGLMLLACSLVVGYLLDVDQPAAIPTALIFVGLGLAAAAMTRSDERMSAEPIRRGGTWWGMLSLGLALVLGLGFVASLLFTPDLLHLVARGFRAFWGLLDQAIGAIGRLLPSSCTGESGSSVAQPTGTTLALQGAGEPVPMVRGPASRILSVVGLVLIGGIVLAAAWSVAVQLFERMRRGDSERVQIESLPGALRLDLVRMLRRLLSWLGRAMTLGLRGRRRLEEPSQITSVRRLYGDMLRWGAASGHPRESSQTPFEYQQTLCTALPSRGTEVTFITESYVRAKYGGRPPTETELRLLRESRRRLRYRAPRGTGNNPTSPTIDEAEDHDGTQR